jgi:hypothetical protein
MKEQNKTVRLSTTEIKLSKMIQKHLKDNNLILDKVRTGEQTSDIPVGGRSLFMIVKQRERISLNLQTKLIEFFGLDWELKIKKS